MYKYETHLHTAPVSACAEASVEDTLKFYKSIGYDGVFITNHFVDGNLNVDRSLPLEEQIKFYFTDYEKALELSKEIGIKVFLGVEFSCKGSDFLVYGLDKEWYLNHLEIFETSRYEERLQILMDNDALVIQAHPFRKLYHIRLFPIFTHGVEITNASRSDFENKMAKIYCEQYELIPTAGSDNHVADKAKALAGVATKEPIESVEDFIAKVKNREIEIFHLTPEDFNKDI